MSRSFRVRPECISQVKQAMRRHGFLRQIDLATELNLSRSTVCNFLNGKPVDALNFIEICHNLSLNYREIEDLGECTDLNHSESYTNQAPETRQKRVVLQAGFPAIPVWQGRNEVLGRLTAQLRQQNHRLNVLVLVGQGGIGKTSLAVKLLETIGVNLSSRTLASTSPYELVMYFKVQAETRFNHIAEFILRDGFGIETVGELPHSDEKINQIIEGLAQQHCLLVLDNLETILYPANHAHARQAISPDCNNFLNALADQHHNSQIILTSREIPATLADLRYQTVEPDSELVHIETLPGVTTEAGVEILRQRHLNDTQTDLRWVVKRVEGHVFLLTQLAAIGKGKPGYLRQHPELVIKKAEPILREQLARQSTAAIDLLYRMSLLQVEMDIQGLTFLRLSEEHDLDLQAVTPMAEPIAFSDEEICKTEEVIEQLVKSSLVQSRYDEENREVFYSLHQVIVEFLQANYPEECPIPFCAYTYCLTMRLPVVFQQLAIFQFIFCYSLDIGKAKRLPGRGQTIYYWYVVISSLKGVASLKA
ncbi:MAG: NB-ARC domain-containing protein [Coleofasciculus sp. C2-GNP5-27]